MYGFMSLMIWMLVFFLKGGGELPYEHAEGITNINYKAYCLLLSEISYNLGCAVRRGRCCDLFRGSIQLGYDITKDEMQSTYEVRICQLASVIEMFRNFGMYFKYVEWVARSELFPRI